MVRVYLLKVNWLVWSDVWVILQNPRWIVYHLTSSSLDFQVIREAESFALTFDVVIKGLNIGASMFDVWNPYKSMTSVYIYPLLAAIGRFSVTKNLVQRFTKFQQNFPARTKINTEIILSMFVRWTHVD